MTRKGYKKHKANEPDPKFRNSSVASFVNRMMLGGKKSVATSILYRSLDLVETRMKKPGIEVFEQALRNASPMLEVRPRRVGGATYQVPMEIRGDRRSALAMRWLIQAARSRPGKSMAERLANELMDAAQGSGATIKRKEESHKMAEANKAFTHFRF